MKEVKIMCIYDYHCDWPLDRDREVPLDVCLSCGGLVVVKVQKTNTQDSDQL